MKNLVEIKENEMMETNGGVTNVTTVPLGPILLGTKIVSWIASHMN